MRDSEDENKVVVVLADRAIDDDDGVDDDDIIAIHERSYHDSLLPDHQLLDGSLCGFSQSQTPDPREATMPSQRTVQQRNQRRMMRRGRQQKNGYVTGKNYSALLAASQQARHEEDDELADDDLDASNAFASLQSLLEQQQLSLSLTQETATRDEEMPQQQQEQHEDELMQDVPPQEQNQICSDDKTEKEKGATSKTTTKTAGDRRHDGENPFDATVSTIGNNTSVVPCARSSQQNQTRDFDLSAPLFDEDDDIMSDWNKSKNVSLHHEQPQPTGLDRELERQRERRKSKSKLEKYPPKKHRNQHPSNDYNNNDENKGTDPTHSLRISMDKQREKKAKKHRSKSADTTMSRAERPWKKESKVGRTRSTSPQRSHSSMRSATSTKQPIAMEKSETSLIGFRPSHWASKPKKKDGRGGPLSHLDSGSLANKRSTTHDSEHQRQRKKLAAAAATKTYSKLMPPPTTTAQKSHQSMDITATTMNTTMTTTNNSFRQDFLPSAITDDKGAGRSGDAMDVDIEDDSYNFADTLDTGNANASISYMSRVAQARKQHCPPGKKRRSSTGKSDGGVLLSLLKEVRREINSDNTRLKSGEYPFPNKVTSRFDLFDPRNRAASHMDVTIVGDAMTPWKTSRGERNNRTVLGYIHEHRMYPERNGSASVSIGNSADNVSHSFVWLCFSDDTISRQTEFKQSPKGSQLRIYNAILVPCKDNDGTSTANAGSFPCKYTVLCTELCEQYPIAVLGPLQPDLSELMAQLEAV